MTQFTDNIRAGGAGTPYDSTGRTIPGYNYRQMGGFIYSPCGYSQYGAPITLDAVGVCAAQAVGAAGNATINGTVASGGVATFDVPRNVTIATSDAGNTTQTVTMTGTDVYGVSMTQILTCNGTSTVSGTKAFKTVTRVAVSAALTGNLSVGFGDVIGLPFRVDTRDQIMFYWDSGIITTAGTFVAAVTTTASATTGDVRGTYTPSTATNGTRRLAVWVWPSTNATDSVTALYGVPQA